jgi:CheY-like chemotaxis protein
MNLSPLTIRSQSYHWALMPSTLVLLCGPPLPGRWALARAIEQRLGARRLAECLSAHSGMLARELSCCGNVAFVADGDLATAAERHAILESTFVADQLLVEWRCTDEEAERECFRRYASRPELLARREWERYRADARRRMPIENEELPGRVLRVAAEVPIARAVDQVMRMLPAPGRTNASSPTRHVLVVEDDAEQRTLLADVLHELGFAVELAPDAGVALALLEDGANVDVLISDQRMPGMSGIELTRELRQRHPCIRTVLLTAYGDERTCHEAVAAEAVTLLAKPVRVVDLQRVLDEATARSFPIAP